MTDFSGDRRTFFRQAFGDAARRLGRMTADRLVHERHVRPPGALPEVAFLAACTRCGECSSICPAGAILTVTSRGGLAAGTPYLEPSRIPCIACDTMPCATVCPTDALLVPEDGWAGVHLGRVELHPERCVTFEGKPCRVCIDACPVGERALTADADGHPVLIEDDCVACGVCVRDCITLPSSFSFHPVDR